MHTLASAGTICLAGCVTNHCITVDIDLWTDRMIYYTGLHAAVAKRLQIWIYKSYLVFQNLVIFSESEHLYREALDVGRD